MNTKYVSVKRANTLMLIWSLLVLVPAMLYAESAIMVSSATLSPTVSRAGDSIRVRVVGECKEAGEYPVAIQLKDNDGKSVIGTLRQTVKLDPGRFDRDVELALPVFPSITALWPEEAMPFQATLTFGDAADREVGTIRLYRTPRILRDGIIVLPGFRIPFYVVIMAFLGSLAYVFTSIVRRPLFTAKNISKWIFRILLGPLLGVFLYSISTLINAAPDAYIIGAMCFAVGFYISPILSKMRDLIYSQLAADKKIEDDLAEIEEDNELIQRLFLSSRVAYFLKRQGIMKVSDLASVSDESLKKIAAEAGLDEAYVVNKKKEAQALEGENLSKANISADLLKKLPRDIRYARDLINIETIVPSLTDNERALMHEALEKARTVTAKVK